mmetsp:Transcript_23271/g.32526  ORF Transcript_23271/g.32526 Transcript_23271/m.32526 type:complete len:138 (-) Transcript_23271:61-474(-)
MPIVSLTRRESFSSAHRLHNSQLSDEENKRIYGKCNNKNGHGHNYVLEVTVRGEVDPQTGMVMNLVDLKDVIQRAVIDKLDHKHIDQDVPDFKFISTTENVAVYIWNSLLECGLRKDLLHEVKIWETEKNIIVYKGE